MILMGVNILAFTIKSFEITRKTYEYLKPFKISLGAHFESVNIEVKLILDDGVYGMGEASPSFLISSETPEIVEVGLKDLCNSLVGKDVRNYRKLFDETDVIFKAIPSAKAAVQYAIIDALTASLGVTPFEFFGGAKDKIQTDKTVGIGELEEMVKEAREIYDEGFRVIKVKVGSVEMGVKSVEKIAEATNNTGYIVDANQAFKAKEAIELANKLYAKGVNVLLLEQPVHRKDYDGLKLVRQSSPFPVAADEAVFERYDAFKLIQNGCVDFINIKLMKSGISDALAIVEMAKSAGIGLMIGCMGESALGITQSVDFAAGTGAFTYHDLDSNMLLKNDNPLKGFERKVNELEVLWRERRWN